MPKVREAIKLIEADGWRTVTTKGSHRQFKYQSKDGAAVDTNRRPAVWRKAWTRP